MRESYLTRIELLSRALLIGLAGAGGLFGACSDDPAGIGGNAGAGAAGGTTPGETGSGGASAGSGGTSAAGGESGADGSSGSGAAGIDGQAGSGAGGTDGGGGGGSAGVAGSAGSDAGGSGGGSGTPCLFHSPPIATGGQGGTSGTGGAPDDAGSADSGDGGPPPPDVTIRTSPFLGNYLADSNGRTLYFYGADLAGDCQVDNPPISRCTADCPLTWLPFNAGARVLAAGLDDAAFGTIQRSDGSPQTTYYGWPLYRYKDDLTAGQIAGQGKAKIWHAAEVKLPSIMIMREGTTRYLADGSGHTLYTSSADQAGSGAADPVSNCSGACLTIFERLSARRLSVVQSLEQDDFSMFSIQDGSLQLAYKGAPLYRARADLQGGDMTGTTTQGFAAAQP